MHILTICLRYNIYYYCNCSHNLHCETDLNLCYILLIPNLILGTNFPNWLFLENSSECRAGYTINIHSTKYVPRTQQMRGPHSAVEYIHTVFLSSHEYIRRNLIKKCLFNLLFILENKKKICIVTAYLYFTICIEAYSIK